MGIKNRQDMGQASEGPFAKLTGFCLLPHAPQECGLVPSIGIELHDVVTTAHMEKLLRHPDLCGWSVSPEGVALFHRPCLHDHAEEIRKSALRIPFEVEVDACGTSRQFWGPIHVDFLLSDSECL